jgi:glutamine synthetase
MRLAVQTPATSAELLTKLQEDRIERLWVIYHDYLGRAGAKIIPAGSIASAVSTGVVFARANLDFDHQDHQVESAMFLADSGDFLAVPDPSSYALLPQFPGSALVNARMRTDAGEPWDGCPRTQLARIVDQARDRGYSIMAALEPEFYVLHEVGTGDYVPTNETPMFSAAGLSSEAEFLRRVLDILLGMGVDVPQIGKEYSHGQYELSTRHGDPLRAVDNYFAIRQAVRDASTEFGYHATFMPKPYADWSGNSLHVHLSIWNADASEDLTPEPTDTSSISAVGRSFIGGILDHVEALTGLGSPTVNSYKRLQPGSWAPAHSFWGYGNRSAVVRIPGGGKRRHLEYRASDNSAQPEMLLTGLITAGLDGIERELDPGEPFERDAGHLTPEQIEASSIKLLPRTLESALDALERDDVIAKALGPTVLAHSMAIRRSELARYNLHVHPWERSAYFDIV